MFKHILVPTDGSELAAAAVERGIELAKAVGARVTFLTVLEPYRALTLNPSRNKELIEAFNAATAGEAEGILGAAEDKARAAGVEARALVRRSDHPFLEIGSAAEDEGADLIVISSHGRKGVTRMVLGSQTAKLLATTTLPVLVIR
jgi:nucleotide-binding universal stress UspA family protein